MDDCRQFADDRLLRNNPIISPAGVSPWLYHRLNVKLTDDISLGFQLGSGLGLGIG